MIIGKLHTCRFTVATICIHHVEHVGTGRGGGRTLLLTNAACVTGGTCTPVGHSNGLARCAAMSPAHATHTKRVMTDGHRVYNTFIQAVKLLRPPLKLFAIGLDV